MDEISKQILEYKKNNDIKLRNKIILEISPLVYRFVKNIYQKYKSYDRSINIEDITNDIICNKLLGKDILNCYNPDRGTINSWLYTICINYIRNKVTKKCIMTIDYVDALDNSKNKKTFSISKEDIKSSYLLLAFEKKIIIMYYFDNIKTNQIAIYFKKNKSTISRNIAFAKQKIRTELIIVNIISNELNIEEKLYFLSERERRVIKMLIFYNKTGDDSVKKKLTKKIVKKIINFYNIRTFYDI